MSDRPTPDELRARFYKAIGNPEAIILMTPTREAREVPLGWEHPMENGNYIPLYPYVHREPQFEHLGVWGEREAYEREKAVMMPDITDLAPEQIGIAAYETRTDGTPLSPTFPNTPEGRFELLKYCSENKPITPGFGNLQPKMANIAEWGSVLFGEDVLIDAKTGEVKLIGEEGKKS